MPLESLPAMLAEARRLGYAIGYFESWDVSSLQGVIDAAEQTRSPLIIGFNGDFLSSPERRAAERLEWYAALGRAAAESASVPCALMFNECTRDDWSRRAVDAGFNVIGIAPGPSDLETYRRRLSELVVFAHARGVAVEGEIGELPCGADGGKPSGGSLTNASAAADLVEQTGMDLLAVSVGNVHIQIDSQTVLDLNRLKAIRDAVPVPLVLHGGTGISADSTRSAIKTGVAKVNYGTYLKQRYLNALSEGLNERVSNPHELLGIGGELDLMVSGRLTVRDAVLERIDWLGCCGKA